MKYVKYFYYYWLDFSWENSPYFYITSMAHLMGGIKSRGKKDIDILEEILDILFNNHIISIDEYRYFINFFNNSIINDRYSNNNAINHIMILDIIKGKCIEYNRKNFKNKNKYDDKD